MQLKMSKVYANFQDGKTLAQKDERWLAIVKATSISSDVSFHKKKLGLAASAKEKEHFLVLCDILTSFSLLFILLNKTFEGHCLRSSSS